MIILGVAFLYIHLSQEWPAAKVKAKGEQTILGKKNSSRVSVQMFSVIVEIFYFLTLTLT